MKFSPVIFSVIALGLASFAQAAGKPNIIILYADDLGYGDVGCYGATTVHTPHIDRLAREGLRFTDGHAAAATCTPSRYALLTGEYAWRKPGTGVLPGDAALIIDPQRTTLPSMLQKAGYATCAIGKWHLGLGDKGGLDWNGDIKPGPKEIGFDYSFIMPATGDRVPCVYLENGRVANLDPKDPIQVNYQHKIGDEPTGKENPELLKMLYSHGHDMTIVNGISRIGWMTGGKAARWNDETLADTLAKKAIGFIEQHKDQPFFLYFAAHDIHVPRVPNPRFAGKTPLGPRGDVIDQVDDTFGQVLAALDRLKLADNTIVILSSDNGPVIDDGYKDQAVEKLDGHKPAGPLRGGKYTAWEGGTREPFIVRWPGHVKPGVSDALVCQVDFLASFAALTNQSLPADAAPDSFNVMPALLGESKTGRDVLIEQGGPMAVRQGLWKLIIAQKAPPKKVTLEDNDRPVRDTGAGGSLQLFNLAEDLAETKNVADQQAEKVKELSDLLTKARADGRTR
ncbi:MAG: arylsulfatase [Chthoniobacter sp.]|uniref:sulfatase family protein n=1 Tax=Chthoniobacter sp. TaxID=2510640 RepID=UPI0032A8DA04